MEDWHKLLLRERRGLLFGIPRLESGQMKFLVGGEDDSVRILAENRQQLAEIESILTKAGVPFDA